MSPTLSDGAKAKLQKLKPGKYPATITIEEGGKCIIDCDAEEMKAPEKPAPKAPAKKSSRPKAVTAAIQEMY